MSDSYSVKLDSSKLKDSVLIDHDKFMGNYIHINKEHPVHKRQRISLAEMIILIFEKAILLHYFAQNEPSRLKSISKKRQEKLFLKESIQPFFHYFNKLPDYWIKESPQLKLEMINKLKDI